MNAPVTDTSSRDSSTSSTPTSTSTPETSSTGGSGGGGTTGGEVASAVGNSAYARALEDGGFFIDLGPGITISPDDMSARVNLEDKPQLLPGVHLRELRYSQRRRTATVVGDVTVPHLRTPRRGLSISINREGQTSLSTTLTSDLPVFKNKRLEVSLDETHNLSATLTIEPTDLTPRRGAGNLSVTGGGVFTLANGKLSGSLEADLQYPNLASGHLDFNFNSEGAASGSGNVDFESDYLNGATASLEIDEEGNLKADASIPISEIDIPVQGLSVTEGTVRLTMDNSVPGGGLESVKLVYNGLAEAVINANIRNGVFSGNGTIAATLSELTDVSGRLNYSRGILTGGLTIRSRDFPSALRVESGSITATLQESGDIDLGGSANINLGPAGSGELTASKVSDLITIGTTVTLENIPGLQSGEFSLEFNSEGKVEGEGELQTDDSIVPGLSGRVQIAYRENLWSGETELTYAQEDPSVNGSITVGVRQTEEGTLVFYGSGNLTAEVIPGVEGSAGVVIDEDGNVVLTFAFTQLEPYELFPERRQEREFVNISKNIPLWAAIVVAVIRIRAGVRAGVGPGQIRNSRIEGTWEITSDEPPDLTVSTEFFMPAFVEGYVAFGAGLGIDVLLGSMTGGIEAVATAGLYGAISVVPELSYEDGDWMFDGTATLAAGARLKLSLNAWAEVEALWITVWENTWELASHTMNIGPDLVLSANVLMNLSNPSPPEITFDASDTDNEGLIDSAMPEDGPPGAGTREAVENRAEWAGRSREQGPAADSVPSDLASQANQTEDAPAAPQRPSRQSGPPAGQQADGQTGGQGDRQASGSQRAGGRGGTGGQASGRGDRSPGTGADQNTNQSAQVPGTRQPAAAEADVVGTDRPRYPNRVSLATLNEPAAPMPRTAAQQREDLNAADQVFRLVENQVEDSEQLAGYFDRIRRRFQLTSIGYETNGGQTQVKISINPDITRRPSELAKGRGIAGKQTLINYTPGRIRGSSDTVGVQMVADPLGPDHPAGSGPSGQSDLMNRLVTDPGQPSDKKYIRGHLLNDRVGGEGAPRNLFPITGAANRAHEQQIESRVKTWVNSDRYWVYYKVNVSVGQVDISDASKKRTNKVNSRFVCEAAVYDLQNNKHNRITASIVSTYNPPANATLVENATGPDRDSEVAVATRAVDRRADIEQSSRETQEYRLNAQIYRDLANVRRRRKSWAQIRQLLQAISGLGQGRMDTLQNAYNLSGPRLPDIGGGLATAGEKSNLTVINGLAGEIHSALSVWM